MSKYIDAEKLKAEIERRIRIKENLAQHPEMSDLKESLYDIIGAYKSLKSFIFSLQQEQPEVDLAEEITRFFSKNPIPYGHITDWPLLKNTAIHFYELGLNARKEG